MGIRLRKAGLVVLMAAALVIGVLISLAANPATGQAHWPWGLDVIRRHPFPSLALLLVVAVLAAVAQPLLARGTEPVQVDPDPPAAPAIPGWVVDREQARQVGTIVRARRRDERAVAITTGLLGAGGFGKTTVARLV